MDEKTAVAVGATIVAVTATVTTVIGVKVYDAIKRRSEEAVEAALATRIKL